MRRKVANRGDEETRTFIDRHLENVGFESVSYMVNLLRDNEYAFPTRNNAACDEFERLGYKLKTDTNKYGSILRTYVFPRS